jgi:hypothetical protein
MPKKIFGQAVAVATGSLQNESVRCADLWPVSEQPQEFVKVGRPAGPWLQLIDDCSIR